MNVAIITPTYNRERQLYELYKSLLLQSVKNFKWYVVDDGSIDNTCNLINRLKSEKEIEIEYFKKNNGGKHTAINYVLSYIEEELIFILDSDDTIVNNAIEIILDYYIKYNSLLVKQKIGCFSFLKSSKHNNYNFPRYDKDEFIGNYLMDRINTRLKGDCSEVFISEALKKYRFPVFENEKFIQEDSVWLPFSDNYNTVYINTVIYLADYQTDGLTKSIRKYQIKSPQGMCYTLNLYLSRQVKLSIKFKKALLYNMFAFFDKKKSIIEYFNQSNNKFMTGALVFPAFILFLIYRVKIESR